MLASTSPRVVLALLCVAQLMVILDISAVNVALPDLSRDLGIPRGDLEWTITSYSLLFGSLLLLGGRAADRLGRRRTFMAGLGVFTAGSLAAALAPDAGALYAARAAQGVGAALLSPAALSIIVTTFASGAERARALAVWGAVGGAGGAVGVLLGGVLTEWIDWRAIFFVNVPIGALLAVGVARTVRPDAEPARRQGLDARGALVATASLATLLYALAGADEAGWLAPRTLALGLAALAGLGAFAALERRTPQPLLRVERLADRAVGGGWALMLLASAVLMGTFLLTSVYLQEVLGASALETGVGLLPAAVAAGAGAHLGGSLVQRHGVRGPMALAFALATTGMLLLSGAGAGGTYVADVLPGLVVGVGGLGIAMVAVAVAVLTGARHEETGMLSGLNTTGHEIGGALGVAALTTIAAGAIGAGVPGRDALATGLSDAFLAGAGIAAAGLVLALAILPRAGAFLPKLRAAPAHVSMH